MIVINQEIDQIRLENGELYSSRIRVIIGVYLAPEILNLDLYSRCWDFNLTMFLCSASNSQAHIQACETLNRRESYLFESYCIYHISLSFDCIGQYPHLRHCFVSFFPFLNVLGWPPTYLNLIDIIPFLFSHLPSANFFIFSDDQESRVVCCTFNRGF